LKWKPENLLLYIVPHCAASPSCKGRPKATWSMTLM
jgi:hypothetical protein